MEELLNGENIQYILKYGYLVMFLIMLWEGPMITFMCAFIASSLGYFNIFFIIILGIFGDFFGDLIFYALGRFSGNVKIIKKFSNAEIVQSIKGIIKKSPILGMTIAKFTPYAQPVSLTFIGFSKFSFNTFAFYSFLLSIPSSIFFGIMGYFFGNKFYELYQKYENIYMVIGGVIIVILIVLFVYKFVTGHLAKKIIEENE